MKNFPQKSVNERIMNESGDNIRTIRGEVEMKEIPPHSEGVEMRKDNTAGSFVCRRTANHDKNGIQNMLSH